MGYLEIRAPFNKRKVESAEELWSLFVEYIDHSYKNPIVEPKIFNSKTGVVHGELDKPRPLTINAFCNYVGMSPATWDNWKKIEKEKSATELYVGGNTFLDVLLQVESIIYDNQYQGAAVDMFNASIVSRKLGLVDKQQVDGKTVVVIDGDEARL